MRRTRQLAAITVTHLETHHAYTSPPIPEKGGLPTIIVTPAEPASAQDFQIHFLSPKATQTTFPESSFNFVSSGFRSFFGSSPTLEDTEEMKERPFWSIIPHSSSTQSGEYIALPMDDNEEGNGTWIPTSTAAMGDRRSATSFLKRRTRVLIWLSIPVSIIAFHCITHRLGLIGGVEDIWGDASATTDVNTSL